MFYVLVLSISFVLIFLYVDVDVLIFFSSCSSEVDITGVSCRKLSTIADMTSRCRDINSQFCSIAEDPFQSGNSKTDSSVETTESGSDEVSM